MPEALHIGLHVPEHLHGGLRRYVRDRIAPGSFLSAVLCNDLRGAFAAGDERSLDGLPGLMIWLEEEAPNACWGSPQKFAAWLSAGLDALEPHPSSGTASQLRSDE